MTPDDLAAIRAHHAGVHIEQPCYVGDFPCDVNSLLAEVDRLTAALLTERRKDITGAGYKRLEEARVVERARILAAIEALPTWMFWPVPVAPEGIAVVSRAAVLVAIEGGEK